MIEQIKKFQEWGFTLVPLKDKDKKPKSKFTGKYDAKGKKLFSWKKSKGIAWSDQELLDSSRLGVDHEASNIIDIDFDKLAATKFMHMLPETLTIGKDVEGETISTHELYRYDGNKKSESYGKNTDDGCVIELLTNTQTHIAGDRLITHDTPPKRLTDSEFQHVREVVKKIYALTILSKHYPQDGGRDEYVMRVAGTLARECKHWTYSEKEDFIEELCKANNDVDELDNRTAKVGYQEEQLKLGHEVHGVKSLCEFINVKSLDCIDAIKPEAETAKGITAFTLGEFIQKQYPPVEYCKYPLLATETITQIWSAPGIGKTHTALEMATSLCNGEADFWKYKTNSNHKDYPALYLEGEMRASSLMDRLTTITQRYIDKGKKFNFDKFYIAPLVEQEHQNFRPLNEEVGRKNVEIKAEQIYKKHGVKPFIFLDNISCLTSIQEKDGVEWLSFMSWLVKLRARGYSVVFLHHATKAGDTSSGSNMKERAVDIEMKLENPEPNEVIEEQDGAQFKVSYPKWREFKNSSHAKPFIACLHRNTADWSMHEVMTKTKRKVENALANGGVDEAMTATGLSKSQVYKYRNEIRKETTKLNKEENSKTRFKLSPQLKKHNRQEAEKIIEAKLGKGELKDEIPF